MKDKEARAKLDTLVSHLQHQETRIDFMSIRLNRFNARVNKIENAAAPKCPSCNHIVDQEEFRRIVDEMAKKAHKK